MQYAVLVLILIVLSVVFIYNALVRLRVQCDNAWADVDVQLKRRYDLIPNLVETVNGYAVHEKGTLEAVIVARNRAMSVQGPAGRAAAEETLSGALQQLFALAEQYPQLRAVESFQQLQGTLTEIEDTVQNARRYYNAAVRDFNTRIAQFPFNFIANAFGFTARAFFELGEAVQREVPAVRFDIGAR